MYGGVWSSLSWLRKTFLLLTNTEHVGIMFHVKENCLLLKLYRKLRKMFLSPRWESNPQPSDLRWDTLTIELLRWQREGHNIYRFVRYCGFDSVWGSETFFWVCDKACMSSKQFSFNLPSCKSSFIHIYVPCSSSF